MSIEKLVFGDPIVRRVQNHLQLQTRRAEIISGNLANLETPGFKARDVNFEAVLSHKQGTAGAMTRTDSRHMTADNEESMEISVDENENTTRVDGNTVDLDNEMGKLAHVQLMYEAGLNAIGKKLSILNKAIDGKAI